MLGVVYPKLRSDETLLKSLELKAFFIFSPVAMISIGIKSATNERTFLALVDDPIVD